MSDDIAQQALIYAVILAIFFYPLALICLFIIFIRASTVQCRSLVNFIVTLMMVGNFAYPTSRFFFYGGYENNSEIMFTICAIFAGVSATCFNVALWLFAIKMWALAQNVITLQNGGDPNANDRKRIILYRSGIVLNTFCGVFTTLALIFYQNAALLVLANFYLLMLYGISCGFFVHAWYKISHSCEQQSAMLIDMTEFKKFIIAFGLVVLSILWMVVATLNENSWVRTSAYLCFALCLFGTECLLLQQLNDFITKIKILEENQFYNDCHQSQYTLSSVGDSSTFVDHTSLKKPLNSVPKVAGPGERCQSGQI